LFHQGIDPPPPDFAKSVTKFYNFFFSFQTPCLELFVKRIFFKNAWKIFKFGVDFSEKFGPTDKKTAFGLKWILSIFLKV